MPAAGTTGVSPVGAISATNVILPCAVSDFTVAAVMRLSPFGMTSKYTSPVTPLNFTSLFFSVARSGALKSSVVGLSG